MPRHASELTVHDDALRANTRAFVARTGGKVMAVVKADGFGHGAIARSVLEAGATALGVTSIDEALALRESGIAAPTLSWLNDPGADFDAAIRGHIDIAVPSVEILWAIARAAVRVGQPARIHLHIDIGIGRDGCPRADWATLCTLARELEAARRVQVTGIMGHFSCADTPAHPQNAIEQFAFDNAVRTAVRRGLTPSTRHVAATAATATGVGAGYDLHRIGAGLFGIDPSRAATDLRPALSLHSTVVSSRRITTGTGVGYGHDFIADAPTNLALIPLGYGDGVPRNGAARAAVLVRGRRRRIVGRCSMDMLVIDTGDDLVTPGERVTLFGPGDEGEPTVTDWARWCDTIEHEIVTRLGSRAFRIHRTTSPQGATT